MSCEHLNYKEFTKKTKYPIILTILRIKNVVM